MVHGGIGSSHSITVDDGDVKLNTSRKDTHAISTTTISFVLVKKYNLIRGFGLHFIDKDTVKLLATDYLTYSLDPLYNLGASGNSLVDHTRTTVPRAEADNASVFQSLRYNDAHLARTAVPKTL